MFHPREWKIFVKWIWLSNLYNKFSHLIDKNSTFFFVQRKSERKSVDQRTFYPGEMLRKKHFTQLIGENYSWYERSNFWRTLWVFTVSRTSKGGRGGGTNCADIPDSRDKVGVTLKASPPFQPSHFKDDIGGQESLLRRSCGLRCLIRKSLARPTDDTFCPKLASLPPFPYSLDRDTYEKVLKKKNFRFQVATKVEYFVECKFSDRLFLERDSLR